MAEQNREQLNRIFSALSDPTRREIVRMVAARERTVSELAEPFDMSLAAISKHVKVLEQAGLLLRTVAGRTHVCSLDAEALSEAEKWLKFYERFWSARFDALERVLGEQDRGRDGEAD